MIKLKNVKKKYKGKVLFSNVNLKIDKPGIYCFVGENGSGKTTLLNIIAGFVKASKGKVINNFKEFSFISQKVYLLDNLTVKEHLMMFNLDVNVLRKFNMISAANKYPRELSFGMQQRVAILISLYRSSLIICDEPTSHLDNYNASLIMKEIKRVSHDKIILLVTHDKKIIDKYCDCIYKIENNNVTVLREMIKKDGVIKPSRKSKVKLRRYMQNNLFFNRINVCYMIIFFLLVFFLNLTVNLKQNFRSYLKNGELEALDYNKFYLSECEEKEEGNIVLKNCSNLKEEKIELLNRENNKVTLNYDVFLNDLYDVDNLNVISKSNYVLKEGYYPKKYNEVVASNYYSLGEEIVLEANKIINDEKIDIYKERLVLKVVGIAYSKPLFEEDKIYLDYNLMENYIKNKLLINNKKTLYEYFSRKEIDTYKYVIYFNNIDLEVLKNNNIEYLSSSYEYYVTLDDVFNEVIKCLNYLSVFAVFTSIIYGFRLIKKKLRSKEKELIFFRASGISKKKIIRAFHKENKLSIIMVSIITLLLIWLIGHLVFKQFSLNLIYFIFIDWLILFFNKYLLKKEIKRKMTI